MLTLTLIKVEDLGVHSFRKGAAGYISSGSTCAPPQVATNLQAGSTMGVKQDTYLKYKAARDQYFGRVESGIPVCSAKFAILPPQLDDCDVETSGTLVKNFFPGIPSHFNYCCTFFAASLLYHLEKLKTIISPSHPLLLASFAILSQVEQLRKKVSVSYDWVEDSVTINVVCGEQEQELQGLLSSSSGTGSSGNISLGSDDQTMPEGTIWRIQKATETPVHVMLRCKGLCLPNNKSSTSSRR